MPTTLSPVEEAQARFDQTTRNAGPDDLAVIMSDVPLTSAQLADTKISLGRSYWEDLQREKALAVSCGGGAEN